MINKNVADAMGIDDRGKLDVGKRADFRFLEGGWDC